jgi:hypothetical protein
MEKTLKAKNNEGVLDSPDKVSSNSSLSKSDCKNRYIYMRKNSADPIANLIDDLILKCNQKSEGAVVEFSSILNYALSLLKADDIKEIQNRSLTDEDRANEEVKKFNIKHGTNYTMFEFVLNGLQKKSKKGVIQ